MDGSNPIHEEPLHQQTAAVVKVEVKPQQVLNLSKSVGESFSCEESVPFEFKANPQNIKSGDVDFKPEKPLRKSLTEGVIKLCFIFSVKFHS